VLRLWTLALGCAVGLIAGLSAVLGKGDGMANMAWVETDIECELWLRCYVRFPWYAYRTYASSSAFI